MDYKLKQCEHNSKMLTKVACLSLLSPSSMKKLKEEMEGVVKELAENNHILER